MSALETRHPKLETVTLNIRQDIRRTPPSTIILPSLLPSRITFLLRIANRVVMDSCCRGGIVHIRCGYSCERSVRPKSSKALWRFRASTSNSPSGRSRPPTYTLVRHIYHTYAQQGIRVCGDDHCEPPKLQSKNPKALWLLRVSI